MLGKLIKNEFKAYRFPFGVLILAGAIFTIFLKVMSCIPYSDENKDGMQLIFFSLYIIMVLAIHGIAYVMVVVRFYNTAVTDQAYLTWTLPAKTSTILWSKLIGGILWRLICMVVIALLSYLFFAGDYWFWSESFLGLYGSPQTLKEIFQSSISDLTMQQWIVVVLKLIGQAIWSVASLVLIYMCMGLGQLFGKYRVIASIGFYFACIIALQILAVIGASVFYTSDTSMYSMEWGECVIDILEAGVAFAIVFAVTNFLFKKHLNLD